MLGGIRRGGRGSAQAGGRGGQQRRWLRPKRGPRGIVQAWVWRATVTAGDRTTARRMPPPSRFRKWGSSSCPPLIVAYPWTAMTR